MTLKHRRLFGILPCVVCIMAGLLNVVHVLVHGTALDSGALDGVVNQFNMWAATYTTTTKS